MILGWVMGCGSLLSLVGSVSWMRWRSRRRPPVNGFGQTVAGEFSPDRVELTEHFEGTERFETMERLLSKEDFLFLQTMPGYKPEIGARWRRDQRRVFRFYLDELVFQFLDLHASAKAMLAHAPSEASSMVGTLMLQKMAFWRELAFLETKLALESAGIGSVDAKPLLRLVTEMRGSWERAAATHAVSQ